MNADILDFTNILYMINNIKIYLLSVLIKIK